MSPTHRDDDLPRMNFPYVDAWFKWSRESQIEAAEGWVLEAERRRIVSRGFAPSPNETSAKRLLDFAEGRAESDVQVHGFMGRVVRAWRILWNSDE